MSRYAAMFERLNGEGAFGAFLMLGDPDLQTSARLLDAVVAGADSVLIADIPALEAGPFVARMAQAGIETLLIAAANTPEPTLKRIAALSKAYTYCVSRAGITGTHAGGQFDAALIDRVKAAGAPPPVFGFGISAPE